MAEDNIKDIPKKKKGKRNAHLPVEKMTPETTKQWDSLYGYVRKEILLYDDAQSISNVGVLKLKGLRQGKDTANRATPVYANYSYETILYTFKLCKMEIMNAISGKTFKNEISKITYITKIVENNINDVYERIKKAKETKAKTETVNVDTQFHEAAEYVPNIRIENNDLKNLW